MYYILGVRSRCFPFEGSFYYVRLEHCLVFGVQQIQWQQCVKGLITLIKLID
jgi:hypothetical protein